MIPTLRFFVPAAAAAVVAGSLCACGSGAAFTFGAPDGGGGDGAAHDGAPQDATHDILADALPPGLRLPT